VSRFAVEVTCPQCAGSVTAVNSCASGLLSVAILECKPCRRQFEVTVRLSVHRTPEQVQMAEKRAGSRQRAREKVGA
jgi:transcription elongation factor Elf1